MRCDPKTPDLAPPRPATEPPLPVNELARAYQPRRNRGAILSIAWNLILGALVVSSGAAEEIYYRLKPTPGVPGPFWFTPAYLTLAFLGWSALNLPLELWQGYLEERQFGLAKEGIRSWTRDWVIASAQHGLMVVTGSCLILLMQRLAGHLWLVPMSAILLVLMLGTTWLAAGLIPRALFSFQPADRATLDRIHRLLPPSIPPDRLPRAVIYSYPSLWEYAGGIIGLGGRQVLLLSRSTLENASDCMLQFVLLHDLGHRRYHHNLLSTLAGWAWVLIGLAACDMVIGQHNPLLRGSPLYIVHLALGLTLWMTLGQPVLAWLGRRLEYQADRFYLRQGGTWDQMRIALVELARRNLARTERLRRRQTIFHPLPSIANRLFAARKYLRREARLIAQAPAAAPVPAPPQEPGPASNPPTRN